MHEYERASLKMLGAEELNLKNDGGVLDSAETRGEMGVEPTVSELAPTDESFVEDAQLADRVSDYVLRQNREIDDLASRGVSYSTSAYSPAYKKHFRREVFDKQSDFAKYVENEKSKGAELAVQWGIADWATKQDFDCIQVTADCLGVYKGDVLIAMAQSKPDHTDDRSVQWIYGDSQYISGNIQPGETIEPPLVVALSDRYEIESAMSLRLSDLPLDYVLAMESFLGKVDNEQLELVVDAVKYYPLANKSLLIKSLKLAELGDEYIPTLTKLIYYLSRGSQGVDEYAVSYLVNSLNYVADNIQVIAKLAELLPAAALDSIMNMIKDRVAESLLAVHETLSMKEVKFRLEDGGEARTTNLSEISESMFELHKAIYAIKNRLESGPEERLVTDNGLITYSYANRSLLLQLRAETAAEQAFDKSVEFNREPRGNLLVDTQDLNNPQPIPLDIKDPVRMQAVSLRLDFSSAQRGDDGYTLKGEDGKTVRDHYAEDSQAEFDMGALTKDENDPNWKIAKMLSLGNGLASAKKGVAGENHHIVPQNNWLNSRRNFQELIQGIDATEYARLSSKAT